MDEDGERYIDYLRRFSQALLFTRMAQRKPEKYALPGEGFIYEDNGKLIGNITLSTIKIHDETVYLISNVAVLPEYRGKGIAKSLTRTALQYIESKGVKQIWLQVKRDNQPAIDLYDQFSFQTFMTRTTWIRKRTSLFLIENKIPSIRKRKKSEWETQKRLLERTYPAELTSAYCFEIASIQPVLRNVIKDVLRSRITNHWAVEIDQQVGFASYELFPEQTYVNLWIAAPEAMEKRFLSLLIPAVHARIGKEIRVNYPEKEHADCFRAIGMQELNTLIWKRKYIA
jgi:GNAT superfamily N-acetyltransferase